MKTALVTKDRYVFVPGSAEVLLEDKDYLKIMVDMDFRRSFLESLGVSRIYVQRLGYKPKQQIPKYFTLKDVMAPEFKYDRYRMEAGVIARV